MLTPLHRYLPNLAPRDGLAVKQSRTSLCSSNWHRLSDWGCKLGCFYRNIHILAKRRVSICDIEKEVSSFSYETFEPMKLLFVSEIFRVLLLVHLEVYTDADIGPLVVHTTRQATQSILASLLLVSS